MNLERNSSRTAEISKLLYDTYRSQIQFTSDTSFTVSFSKYATIDVKAAKLKLPFGVGVYEPTLMMEIISEKTVDLASLDRIRSGFVKNYFTNNRQKDFPNVLFDFQKRLMDAGYLQPYNYWILMKGDEDTFIAWKDANVEKWNSFVEWFNPNQLKIEDENKFIRTRYLKF